MNVLIIDNYDSFTFNLYQFIGEILTARLGAGKFNLLVKRNNEITLTEVIQLNPDRIFISPGPGSPDDERYFGVCAEVIRELGKQTPLLGVCLGMQGIAHVFGGEVIHAQVPMHGKSSPITHDEKGVFNDIPQGLEVMRYHSLIAERSSLPDCLEISAYIQTEDAMPFDGQVEHSMEIMGLRHRDYPIQGIQFHPESFASEGGKEMIENFLWQK